MCILDEAYTSYFRLVHFGDSPGKKCSVYLHVFENVMNGFYFLCGSHAIDNWSESNI